MPISIKAGAHGREMNVGGDSRADIRGFTDSTELLLTNQEKKLSISNGDVTFTGPSAVASLTYTGNDTLVISSNSLQLLDVVGAPTGKGAVVVESNAAEVAGTFADFDVDFFNWNIGKSNVAPFTARKGADGDAFTGATQTIRGYFESPTLAIVQAGKFLLSNGAIFNISVELPAGVSSASVIWTANVYEDDSARVREI